jgi:signal transduction histidine kinase/CheY-like chemotaxis protein
LLAALGAGLFWGIPHLSQQEYKVGYGNFAPYLMVKPNGGPAGLAVDLFDEAARRLNVKLTWVEMKKGPDNEIPNGSIDLEPILAISEKRKKRMYLTAPWWENNLGLATDADQPISEASATAGKRLGVINGSFGVAMAKASFPQARIVPFTQLHDMVGSVCEGATDAVMIETRMFQNLWGEGVPPCQDRKLTFRFIEGLNVLYGIGSRYELRRDADLFHKKMVEMSFDGTLTKFGQRYGVQATNQMRLLGNMVVVQDRNAWLFALLLGAVSILALLFWQYFALRREKARAEAASDAKSRFLAMISHEIRTPLNGVLGMAELLRDTELDGRQRDLVGTISNSGHVLLNVLNDVLDYSKAEAKQLHVEQIDFSVDEVLEDTLLLYGGLAEEKGLFLSALRRPEVGPRAIGDPTRLRQTLGNLVNNALKFTERGEVRIRVEAGVQGKTRFLVDDTGPGIDEASRAGMFQPFRQADTSTTRKFGGTGLGLAICQELVQLMNGRIGYLSEPGQGSRFWFEVPLGCVAAANPAVVGRQLVCGAMREETRRWIEELARAFQFELIEGKGEMETEGPRTLRLLGGEALRYPYRQSQLLARLERGGGAEVTAEARRGTPRANGLRVLVAEDNPTNRKLVSAFLSSLGCEAKIVGNGAEAVRALSEEHFDIVLMDYQMPEMDGLEATRAIRLLTNGKGRVPVIGFTAAALDEDRRRCLESGMDEVLTKPLSLAKLEAALQNFRIEERVIR